MRTPTWVRAALSHRCFTGIARQHLGELIAELADPWTAQHQAPLAHRRGHPRQRAAGAPFEAVGTAGGASAVSVLQGSAGGLTATGGRLFTQVGGTVEVIDQFGAQLATGDFNGNGFADLVAAAPEETVATLAEAGAVSVVYGSGGGLTSAGGRLFTQNSPGVAGVAESLDRFGGVGFVAG